METRREELQGMKKKAQRRAAEAVGIDEEDWDGTVESILAAQFGAGGAQAYVTRGAYGVEGRDSKAPIKAAALVIGIQNYEGTRELKNTLSDAKAVAEKFEGMGFDVMSLTDENAEGGKVTQKLMQRNIKKFVDKVDENTIAALAYMGATFSLRSSSCRHSRTFRLVRAVLSKRPPRAIAHRPRRRAGWQALPHPARVPRQRKLGG